MVQSQNVFGWVLKFFFTFLECTFINIDSSFDTDTVNNMLPIINMLHVTTLSNVNHEHHEYMRYVAVTTCITNNKN